MLLSLINPFSSFQHSSNVRWEDSNQLSSENSSLLKVLLEKADLRLWRTQFNTLMTCYGCNSDRDLQIMTSKLVSKVILIKTLS